MSNEIKDLDIIFPDEEIRMTFSGAVDKKRYSITMFIPHGLTLYMAQKGVDANEKQLRTLSMFLRAQHPHMDEEWIKNNLSLQKQNAIFGEMLKEVGKSNSFLPGGGGLDETMMAEAIKLAKEMLKNEVQ